MGLLVIQVLNAVLGGPQKVVGVGQGVGGGQRHQAGTGQFLQCCHSAARAQLGKLAAAHHLQQLHRELDLADPAARYFHVVGPLGMAGTSARGMLANLFVQHAQRVKHVVVQVAAKHKRQHRAAQRPRRAVCDHRPWGDNAAFEPSKTLPFAALGLKVAVQRGQRHGGRPGAAVRAQRQIHAKDEPVFGRLANQGVHGLDLRGKKFPIGDAATARHIRVAASGGAAVLVVDVDQVDVAGHIEFASAQFAHAHHPQMGRLAVSALRRAIHRSQGS